MKSKIESRDHEPEIKILMILLKIINVFQSRRLVSGETRAGWIENRQMNRLTEDSRLFTRQQIYLELFSCSYRRESAPLRASSCSQTTRLLFSSRKNKQTIFIHREANRCRHGLSKNCNEILSHIYRGAKCCEPARDSHEKRDERAKWLNMRWVRKLHSFFKNVAVGSGRKAAGNRRRSARKERKIGDDDMKTWECWSLWLFLVSLTFQTFFLYI